MMGVHYEWADDRQIIMNVHLEYPWSWAEYNAMMATLMPMLSDLKHPCATVVDCSRMRNLPSDGNVLNILLNVEKNLRALSGTLCRFTEGSIRLQLSEFSAEIIFPPYLGSSEPNR